MLGPVNYDLSFLYWQYPGAEDAAAEINYCEIMAKLEYTLETLPLSPTFGMIYEYSPEYYGEDGAWHYIAGTSNFWHWFS